MKRKLIVLLIAVFVISSAFATAGTQVGNSATTEVSLALTDSKATLWFTEGAPGTSLGSNLSEYSLALLPNAVLPMQTGGNEVHGGGSTLYLNWNIISAQELKVYLSVSGFMTSSNERNTDELGWSVSWGTTTTIGKSATNSSLATEGLVHTKTTNTFGNAGSMLLTVLTENAYGLKPDTYTSTLTATVKTTT